MPEWLLVEENYTPLKSRESFIDKSILSMLKILSKLSVVSSEHIKEKSINPHIKFIFTLIIIIMIAISRKITFILIVNTYILCQLSSIDVEKIKNILKLSLVAIFFALIMLLPSVLLGNINNSIMIILKIFATVSLINLLSYTTDWNEITTSLKMIFIPDIFIFVLQITVKYIMILGQLSLEMLYALKMRTIGRSKVKNASLSGIIGTIFLKSKEMSEEMYLAMECRGFTGEYTCKLNNRLKMKDFMYIAINITLMIFYVII